MNATVTDLHILTFPTPTPMGSYRTALWLKANTDHNGLTHAIADIAGIALTGRAPAQYLLEQLFNGTDVDVDADTASELDTDCQSVTGLANGLIRVHITFRPTEFLDQHLCQADDCDGDADCGDSYDGYCPDCADLRYSRIA